MVERLIDPYDKGPHLNLSLEKGESTCLHKSATPASAWQDSQYVNNEPSYAGAGTKEENLDSLAQCLHCHEMFSDTALLMHREEQGQKLLTLGN